MTRCTRPQCTGTIEETGFCDTCYRRPPAGAKSTVAASTGSRADFSTRSTGGATELLSLPVFDFPDPSSRIMNNPKAPTRDRKCHGCDTELPALDEGFCPSCRHPFSFLPSLHKGDLVGGQYEVVGCFARGGFGWVYLARDRNLDDNWVVLKGLIDTGDTALAAAERRTLTMMHHPNIVRIFNFVTHPDFRTGEPRAYIVMEYVDGLVLGDVVRQSAPDRTPLGEPLRVEHVIVCGLQILAALEYLHGRQLLYCDLKPENVMVRSGQHGERVNRVTLIDLGAVRKAGDPDSLIIGTPPYQVPRREIISRGLTMQSDLYALGWTLADLFEVTGDGAELKNSGSSVKVGLESFKRVLARARHDDADHRFASATEMADQLRGVHREIAALRDGTARPEPSTVFAPTPALLDAGLGAVPALNRWLGAGGSVPAVALAVGQQVPVAPLADGRPDPPAAAADLPVPHPDPTDPGADSLAAAGTPGPRQLLAKLSAYNDDSVEVYLAHCRAQLELGMLDEAAGNARRAEKLLADAATHDWRISWHNGLLALAYSDIKSAVAAFDAVYDALPGEDAPKLALGYCAEVRGDRARAEELYQAVWRRDRSQTSAAFGLARIRLCTDDRAGAVEVLDSVPRVSRHAEASAIASVNILCGRLSSGSPTVDDLRAAAQRLPGIYLDGGEDRGDARDRLTTVVREAVFVEWTHEHGPLPADVGPVLGDRPDDTALRLLLERSYRALAGQARSADDHGVLVDLANTIRPTTFS